MKKVIISLFAGLSIYASYAHLSFYIEAQPGQWKQLRLFNPSFEEKNNDIFSGYYVSKRKSGTLQTQLSQAIVKTGQHSLLVTTKSAAPVAMMNAALQ